MSLNNATTDFEIVDEVKDVLGDQFITLLDRFQNDTTEQLSTVEISRASNDYKSVRDAAHSMKSSSYQMGAMQMHHYAEAIETLLNTNTPSTIEDETQLSGLIEGLQRAFASYQDDISAYL